MSRLRGHRNHILSFASLCTCDLNTGDRGASLINRRVTLVSRRHAHKTLQRAQKVQHLLLLTRAEAEEVFLYGSRFAAMDACA